MRMIDREKIITALECCKDVHQAGCWASGCISCGYANKHRPDCFLSLADDAVELLKEQEPIPCGEKIKAGDVVLDFYPCGHCKKVIRKPWRYCPFCGKPVKWE